MTNNLVTHCESLLKSNSYGGNPHFQTAFTWQSQKLGHVLVNKSTNENAVLAVIGQVIEKGLQCSSSGNYHNCENETLEKAKFQLFLGKPVKTIFADDFDMTIKKLASFQTDMALYPCRENFIMPNGRQKTLRFTHNVFEKKTETDNGAIYCLLGITMAHPFQQ